MKFVENGINPISFSNLNIAVTSEESKAINFDNRSKIIISASGMCEAGRIKHHLKHNLWKSENIILFAGYQAVNTLGRRLIEGAKEVKLFGEDITVCAEIRVLQGISGHADIDGLDRWITHIENPKRVFVNHGEAAVTEEYAAHLQAMGINACAPYSGAYCDLATGEFTNVSPIEIPKKTTSYSPSYQRLCASLDRLTAIVKASKGLTNKDLAKLTDTINNLCSKWE
jgi:metallo-beta-lactamase family protein